MSKEEKQSDRPANPAPGTVRMQAHASAVSKAHTQPRLVPDIQALKKIVSVEELRKQGFTKNLPRIDIVPSIDSTGEGSLDVMIVFPKTMREKDVTSPQTSRMISWIQDTILSKAESGGRWPYVFVKVEGKDVCPA